MNNILQHPALGNLLLCLGGVWPLGLALRRVGLSPFWAALLLLNLALPMLGLALVAGILCHRDWPALPRVQPRPIKSSFWGQKS